MKMMSLGEVKSLLNYSIVTEKTNLNQYLYLLLRQKRDEDEEFGGAKLTAVMIYGQDKYPSTSTAIIPVTVEDKDKNEPLYTCQHKIFSPNIATNEWYVDRKKMTDSITNPYQSVTIAMNIDTEYTDKESKKEYRQKSRLGLTTQISSILQDAPKAIFAHTERINGGRLMARVKPLPMVEK